MGQGRCLRGWWGGYRRAYNRVVVTCSVAQLQFSNALLNFVFGEAFNGLEFYNYFFLYEVVLV